jgi:hypothetical protein
VDLHSTKATIKQASHSLSSTDNQPAHSIGTENEKPIHAALKRYYEPHTDSHEVRIGRYIADIVGENGIIEIQTGAFERMYKKLTALLNVSHVTVVYPIIAKKIVYNVDTGRRYNSPKKGTAWHFLPEAYKIRDLLTNENLSFTLCFLTAVEYRTGEYRSGEYRAGIGRKTKKLRIEPGDIVNEIFLNSVADWALFCGELPERFTAKEFEHIAKLYGRDGWCALTALVSAGVLDKSDKQGNAFIYRKLL